MRRHFPPLAVVLALTIPVLVGCLPQQPFHFAESGDMTHYRGVAQEIEFPDANAASLDEVDSANPPVTLDSPGPGEDWKLSLQEVMRISLENSTVLRSLGGVAYGPTGPQGVPSALTQSPALAGTIYGPAMEEANPRTGVEAALSAFDAQLAASVAWDRNDTPQNVAGFVTLFRPDVFKQDLGTAQFQITQLNRTGGRATIRHNVEYEWNNTSTTTRLWPSEWDANVEVEVRQPFAQGAGVAFNGIAGPGAIPGFNNGVLIARLHVDQSLADFEGGVQNVVSSVERAYWQLYYAYRGLETAITGRDATLAYWQKVKAELDAGSKSSQQEAQALQQYWQFVSAVQRAQAGVYAAERHLRYMMGVSPSDGRTIYPADEPITAKITFEWPKIHGEALVRSVDLRKQKSRIQEAELGVIAAKNWLLPRLDGVAQYRWRGLGDDLLDPTRQSVDAFGHMNSAYGSLTSGRFHEWHLGIDFSTTLGSRREMAGVQYAKLALTRERRVLQEQELELMHQLQGAIGDLDLYYELTKTLLERQAAIQREVEASKALVEAGTETPDLVLDALRRLAEARIAYYEALVAYNLALADVHLRKGSLLEYNGVYLAEGPWPAKAYFDARRRARARSAGHYIDYGFTQPKVLSRGPYEQHPGTTQGEPEAGAVAPDERAQAAPAPPLPAQGPAAEPIPAPTPEPMSLPGAPEAPGPKVAPKQPNGAAKPKGQPSAGASRTRAAPGGSAQGYDLGTLDLSGLAGMPEAPLPGTDSWTVRPAGYQETTSPPAANGPRGAEKRWTPIQRSSTGHESHANPSSDRAAPSAAGWQAVQH